jgi:hypothetical protein
MREDYDNRVNRLITLENFVDSRENREVDAFIKFEQENGFQNSGNVTERWCSDDSTSSSNQNELKTIKVRGRKTKRELQASSLKKV